MLVLRYGPVFASSTPLYKHPSRAPPAATRTNLFSPNPQVADDAPERLEQPGDKPEPSSEDVEPSRARARWNREPKTEDPAAEGPPREAKDEKGPMEMCAQPSCEEGVLQRVRRRSPSGPVHRPRGSMACSAIEVYPEEYHATYGTVTTGALWSKYDGFDPRLRFRARLQLPQWDQRISHFAGRVGEEDYISDIESDFDALPTRQFGTLEDDSVLVGLGYSSPNRTGNDFDAGVGVRIDLPMDPYARARCEVVQLAERYVFTARETVFWQNTEGLGSTTRINLDRVISDRYLLRWSNLGKYTEETIGLEWYSQLTLLQSVGQRTGLAYQVQVEGETDNEVPMTRTARA